MSLIFSPNLFRYRALLLPQCDDLPIFDIFTSRYDLIVFPRGKGKGSSFAELERTDSEEALFVSGIAKDEFCSKADT
jgi:hypothetical protein